MGGKKRSRDEEFTKKVVKGFRLQEREEYLKKKTIKQNFDDHVMIMDGAPKIKIQVKLSTNSKNPSGDGTRILPIPKDLLKWFFDEAGMKEYEDFYINRAKRNSESRKKDNDSPQKKKSKTDELNSKLKSSNTNVYTSNGSYSNIRDTDTIFLVFEDTTIALIEKSIRKEEQDED